MKVLNPNMDLAALRESLREGAQKVLLLDYDGTLAPFHVEPDKAVPYPGVREMLNKLVRQPRLRLVMITGRWTKDLLPLLGLEAGVEIWGSHGLERLWPDGSYEIASMDEASLQGLVTADEWVEASGVSGRIEKKPGSVAIHWRGLGEVAVSAIRDRVQPEWKLIAEACGLDLLGFDGGLELRVAARNKGDAVKTILEEMEGPFTIAYFGDDLTDEDAFKALKGRGVGVLVRERWRRTEADIWIQPPEELLAFLAEWMPDKP
jgi:trehalose 6-phosphate phosphatase